MLTTVQAALNDNAAFDLSDYVSVDVAIGTDTTFSFTTIDGLLITLIGRGFRFDARRRRLISGTLKAVFITDGRTGDAITSLQDLSIDVTELAPELPRIGSC
ncbi:hypothetical protein ATO13_16084 [Stappia sp. 22II-S9-Z10]|nr:hypothetical protein ATO13_16084 [Stappia sp. 22II-S9-Z10]